MPLQFGKRRENYETGTRHCTGAAAIGPYSQGIAAGQTVYVSGQLPIDPATGAIPEGIAAQTAQSLKNIQAILAEQGMTLADVVKTTVFLADMNDFAEMNKSTANTSPSPSPRGAPCRWRNCRKAHRWRSNASP